ncbi:MAG: hypothetical protein HYZ57_06055 [Acidobacteria bacterium]|nr:hypothetical protein [Acidobacteriota bacterium]MBI3279390.1 hypothetical protein [Acidobacteriota bacterium]
MPPPAIGVITVIGADSLLGREIRELAEEKNLGASLRLLGSEEKISGVLSEQGEEAILIGALEPGQFADSSAVLLAGSPESSLHAVDLIEQSGARPLIVDLTYALEEHARARLRAPALEPDRAAAAGGIQVIAHPAAIVVTSVLAAVQRHTPVRHAVVHVFEPASERGQAGMNELQQQTSSLLSFRSLSKDVFDAQLSFNMLPRYGSEAPQKLEDIEQRIERHTATLLGGAGLAPMPSLRLAQAPVFHGYSLSFWIECGGPPDTAALESVLADAGIDVRGSGFEAPTNVGSVGQGGVIAGLVERDRNHPRALWLWAVADNYRLLVENALAVVEPVLRGGVH